MSIKELSAPDPPPFTTTPAQARVPSPSNSLGDPPTTNSPPVKKTSGKASKRKVSEARAAEPIDPPARQRARYEPYRRAEPTPEREAALPTNPEDLETLDTTAKTLYKSDREVLEYVETLKRRAAAMSEHVSRTDSQLRACKGVMGRIELYVAQWRGVEDRWTHQQLFGNGKSGAKRVDDEMEVLGPDESSAGHPPFVEA